MKSTRSSDMTTALPMSQIIYQSSLSTIPLTFDTFALPVTVTSRKHFAASLTDFVPDRNFFLHKIPYQSHKTYPQLVKSVIID